MAGMATAMWVSLASSGLPVAVRRPSTTHWLLAPGLRRMTLPAAAGAAGMGCGGGPLRSSPSTSFSA